MNVYHVTLPDAVEALNDEFERTRKLNGIHEATRALCSEYVCVASSEEEARTFPGPRTTPEHLQGRLRVMQIASSAWGHARLITRNFVYL